MPPNPPPPVLSSHRVAFALFAASQDAAHDINTLLKYKVSTVGSMRPACPCLAAHLMCCDMRLAAAARVRAPSSQHLEERRRSTAVTLWLTRGSQPPITTEAPSSPSNAGDMRPPSLCSGCSRAPAYCCLCSLSVMNRTDYRCVSAPCDKTFAPLISK